MFSFPVPFADCAIEDFDPTIIVDVKPDIVVNGVVKVFVTLADVHNISSWGSDVCGECHETVFVGFVHVVVVRAGPDKISFALEATEIGLERPLFGFGGHFDFDLAFSFAIDFNKVGSRLWAFSFWAFGSFWFFGFWFFGSGFFGGCWWLLAVGTAGPDVFGAE